MDINQVWGGGNICKCDRLVIALYDSVFILKASFWVAQTQRGRFGEDILDVHRGIILEQALDETYERAEVRPRDGTKLHMNEEPEPVRALCFLRSHCVEYRSWPRRSWRRKHQWETFAWCRPPKANPRCEGHQVRQILVTAWAITICRPKDVRH